MSDHPCPDGLSHLLQVPFGVPEAPWGKVRYFHVGGLLAVGFGRGSDYLLTITSDGRGIFDCRTGEKIARDRSQDLSWLDVANLEAPGIGPLSGELVRLGGIFGGGLASQTVDSWSAEVLPIGLYEYGLYLKKFAPERRGEDVYRVDPCITEYRAFGFSSTGNSLIAAFSGTTFCWHRAS